MYLKICDRYIQKQIKKNKKNKHTLPKKQLVVKPIRHDEINSRYQIDSIHVQSNPYNTLWRIEITRSKLLCIRPLWRKPAGEIAYQLPDVFTLFEAPSTRFANKIVTSVCVKCGLELKYYPWQNSSLSIGRVRRTN